jgi:AcrR family transcriptional regulator
MTDRPAGQALPRRRADGEHTHAAILEAATRIASVQGVEGLTFGSLAEATGVSKSGLYAHFGSKARLQRETVEAAWAIFEREVMVPTLAAPPGVARLEALFDAYFSYLERGVFPGGCFFAGLLAEMDARTGPIHDAVVALEDTWRRDMWELAGAAQRLGEIRAEVDVRQLVFEIYACLELTSYHYVLFAEREILSRGRAAVDGMLARARARA